MRVAVFCGSSSGADEKYLKLAKDIGTFLGNEKIDLVYGGASIGLMGATADSCLAAGGEVYGVIPQKIMDYEVAHKGLTELKIVENMHSRKMEMYNLADVALIIPGGLGTLDEFFETLTWNQLSYHHVPCGLLNFEGFYSGLVNHLDTVQREGFTSEKSVRDSLLQVGEDFKELIPRLLSLVAKS